MKSVNLTKEQVQNVLNSLVQSYYKFQEIAERGNLADQEIWRGIADEKLALAEIIENQTGVKTFGANSFKSQI